MKRIGAVKVTQFLADNFPDYASEFGWVSRLCRAGLVLIDYPQLNDQSIDRICILRRLPKQHHAEAFTTGRLPNGQLFRDLDREQLRAEIRNLSALKTAPAIESVERKVKRELLAFTNSIPSLVDHLAAMPEYTELRRLMDDWHRELVTVLQSSGPKIRETIYVSPNSNVSRAISV